MSHSDLRRKTVYLVSYDISSNKRRNKIAKCLENYGKRIQYSVFECNIDEKRFRKLYSEIAKLCVDMPDGSVRFYYICQKCKPKMRLIGVEKPGVFCDGDDVIVI